MSEEKNAIYRGDLVAFTERAHMEVEPGTVLLMNWHHEVIAYQLNRVERRKLRRLIVNQPPKTMKTFLIAVAFVAFILGRNPATKILVVSYDEDLAIKQVRQVRQILRGEWFKGLFPGTRIKADKDSERHFETEAGGEVRAVSLRGGITGHGYDVTIMDDIMKADDARKESARRQVEDIFSSTIINRFRDPPNGVLICVMQRLHVDDFTAYLLKTGKFEQLCIPAICEQDTEYRLSEKRVHRFAKGQLLEPRRLTTDYLDEMRKLQGRAYFAAQYQQEPQVTEGHIINPAWFQFYDQARKPDLTILSIDPAFTEDGGNYSACLVIGLVGTDIEIVDGERVRKNFPQIRRWIRDLDKRWKPDLIVIETIGAGVGLGHQLEDDGLKHLGKIASHERSKIERMEIVSPQIEDRRVSLPRDAAFVDPFIKEISQFPYGANDDWPDCLSQVLIHLTAIRREALQHRELRRPPTLSPTLPVYIAPGSAEYQNFWF